MDLNQKIDCLEGPETWTCHLDLDHCCLAPVLLLALIIILASLGASGLLEVPVVAILFVWSISLKDLFSLSFRSLKIKAMSVAL